MVREMTGRVIEQLVVLLQAKQRNSTPYRPQMICLVECYHRTRRECVSTLMADERQNDWCAWAKYVVFAHNSAQHSTVVLSPNVLMMGRRLRLPNELLRETELTEPGDLMDYHRQLMVAMERGSECEERAQRKEQARQAYYYDRKSQTTTNISPAFRRGTPKAWVNEGGKRTQRNHS
ncbi:hypothetical protein L916_19692 [Phytophthora nicotianae]|uniref:Integrase catalytic domain-containing protein n=1 Tax=Phytophthora nicotianae TaxID=4792 RepID=W2HXX1_PHYNI|nr:hypothetical protein L916_19692 [Phytophthora nicotianae]